MIIWSVSRPNSAWLESFLYAFRDKRTSDHICGDCDLAVIPTESGIVSVLVPRTRGTYYVLKEVWHLSVTPYYPYTDILVTPTGITGITDPSNDPLRCRLRNGKIESITIYPHDYAQFVDQYFKNACLCPWYVSQPDGTLRFHFEEPNPTSRHTPLSLEQSYHPDEYLVP